MTDTWVDVDGITRLQGTLVGPAGNVNSVFGRTGSVVAVAGDYYGVVPAALTGATQASRYVGATTSGAPVAGTFAVGDFVIARDGILWVCTAAGTPGTWSQAGGGVVSVAAADTSIVIGGTATAPTFATGALNVLATNHPPVSFVSMNSQKIQSLGLATSGTDAASLANSLSDFAVPSANVPWNAKKITGLANGSSAQDAAAFGQIPTALPPNGAAGGSLNGTYPNPGIANGAVANAQVAAGAAIVASKLANYPTDATKYLSGDGTWTVPGGGGTVTSVTATNGTIVVAGTANAPTIAAAALNTQAGVTALTGDLAMGTNKLTGLSAGSANGNSVRWEQSAAGVMTTTGDTLYASSAHVPARLGVGSDGQVLTLASGLPSWAAPSGGISWTADMNYSGASLTDWTTESGSWSVVSNAFQASPAGSYVRVYHTAQVRQGGLVYQADLSMGSTGSHAGINILGILFNWDGAGTGGAMVGLTANGLTPTSNGALYAESPAAVTGLTAITQHFSLDTFYTVRCVIFGHSVDVYFVAAGGTLAYKTSYGMAASDVAPIYVGLVVYNCVGNFQNIKSWYLSPQ